MDKLLTGKQKNKRKIRCLQDFQDLNRSSLTPGKFLKQSVGCERNKAIKLKQLDYLPKIDIERDKENHLVNSSTTITNRTHKNKSNFHKVDNFIVTKLESKHLANETPKGIELKSPNCLSRIDLENDPENVSSDFYKVDNFVVTELDDVFYPTSSSQMEESPDQEIVFKSRNKKKSKLLDTHKNMQNNTRKTSLCSVSLDKDERNSNNVSSHLSQSVCLDSDKRKSIIISPRLKRQSVRFEGKRKSVVMVRHLRSHSVRFDRVNRKSKSISPYVRNCSANEDAKKYKNISPSKSWNSGINKNNKKSNNISPHLRKHSLLHGSSVNPTESLQTVNVLTKYIKSEMSGTIKQSRKSVRFITPSSQEKDKKRNTFDLDSSTFDISLLPNITSNGKGSYKKSPHVKKLKSILTESNNTFEDYESNCTDNKNTSGMYTMHASESYMMTDGDDISKLQESRKYSVINLVTPNSEEMKKTCVDHRNNNLIQRGSIISLGSSNSLALDNSEVKNTRLNPSSIFLKEETCSGNEISQDLDVSKDSSKINKRRQWNKSQDCSFLDNLSNVSALWDTKQEGSFIKKTPLKNKYMVETSKKSVGKNIPISNTSTPVILKKKTVTVNESKNIKSSSKTKMPNFARIHQRAFEKLENIKEMSQRKAVRAQLLLSGQKPPPELSLHTKPLKIKKELKYNPEKLSNHVVSQVNTPKVTVTIAPSTSGSKVTTLSKPVLKKLEHPKSKFLIPKAIINKPLTEKDGFTKYGFKIRQGTTKSNPKDEVKAVAQKSRIIQDTTEKRRNVIQNVRSNRRFELLMQMRKK